jgi:4-carboxymuconolactone decarboxylase
MARLGPIESASLSDMQRKVAHEIAAGPRGGLRGPFWPWLRSPDLADRAQKLGEFLRFETSLPRRLVELAILVTARRWTAQFEWYAHAPLAREAGLGEAVIAAIAAGTPPDFREDDERVVYSLCSELYESSRVREQTYRDACRMLGERGVVELVGILGYYALVSMTLNVFEVAVPEPAPPPLRESGPVTAAGDRV